MENENVVRSVRAVYVELVLKIAPIPLTWKTIMLDFDGILKVSF